MILIASGSEVQLCIAARERLAQKGIAARVVSMPSWELFERQDQHYRDTTCCRRISKRALRWKWVL